MPDLNFQVTGAEMLPFAAAPQLAFKLRITNAIPEEPIHTANLRCQIRLEPARRSYTSGEKEKLRDLFGEPHRWNQTVRGMLWTHCQLGTPGFSEEIELELPVPCSFDFNIAATKYFAGLEDGLVPLIFLFSGTVFYAADDGNLQVAQIPWEKEAAFALPVKTWQNMMDHYYPNTAWLNLRRDVFDQLYRYKVARGIPTWEQTMASLLSAATQKP